MESLSQHGEDVAVLDRFGHKRGGFFVEVGALDGIKYSNTLLLEKEFSWTGVLVEANPDQARLCEQNRPASTVIAKAVTDPEHAGGTASLSVVRGFEALSGFSLVKVTDGHMQAGPNRSRFPVETIEVSTALLDTVLAEAGAPRDIDFMSIDIEGHEAAALRGLALTTRWRPRVLLVENNRWWPDRAVTRRLRACGYGYVRTLGAINDWYEPMSPSDIRRRAVAQYVVAAPNAVRSMLRVTAKRMGILPAIRRLIGKRLGDTAT